MVIVADPKILNPHGDVVRVLFPSDIFKDKKDGCIKVVLKP
jgi:hypothetical protein